MRDFDILNNRYLEMHDQKLELDDYIYKAEAAQKYFQKSPYNPLTCKFADSEIELAKLEEEKKKKHENGEAK